MQPIRQSLAFVAVALPWLPAAFSAQTWTYQFTPTLSRPYHALCGECSGLVGVRADVAGTFTILLDWDNHKGKVLGLNDYLTNVLDLLSYTETGYESVPSTPPTKSYGIIPAWHYDPIFVSTSISYWNGIGYMKSDGRIPLPGGGFRVGQSYEVWFTPTAATLNMVTGSDDNYITVTGATAAFQSSAWSGDLNHDGRVDGRDYVIIVTQPAQPQTTTPGDGLTAMSISAQSQQSPSLPRRCSYSPHSLHARSPVAAPVKHSA